MSDYEGSIMMGILSAVILFVIMCFLFWALSPLWFGYVSAITTAIIAIPIQGLAPQLSPMIANLTLGVTTVFFALIATPLVYILVLPFLRQPQQESFG